MHTCGLPLTLLGCVRAGRLAALATRAADRTGVSFAGAALHRAYYDEKFARRGGLLYRLMCACVDARACPDGAALLAAQLTCAGAGAARPRLRVASLGGGPGTDVAGLFWAERHVLRFGKARPPRRFAADGGDGDEGCASAPAPAAVRGGLDVTLYDLERSWRRYTPVLGALLAPRISLNFAPCDVRQALPTLRATTHGDAAAETASEAHCCATAAEVQEEEQHEEQEQEEFSGADSNKRLAAAAPTTHLFIFSYVAHETASAAAAAGWAFYASLARAAPHGAVFLFADVRGRAADVFDAIHAAMADALAAAAAASAEQAGENAQPPEAHAMLRRFTPAPREGPPLAAEVMVLLKCLAAAAAGAARSSADGEVGAVDASAELARATLVDA
jgi:hypothetical protein